MMKTNRYARKRKHKRELEKKFAKGYSYGSGQYDVGWLKRKLIDEAENADDWWSRKHPPRNRGWEYWKTYYLSGRRQMAKKYTDKCIRQKYRQMIHHYDPEDVTAPRGADYEKEYDYFWTIW